MSPILPEAETLAGHWSVTEQGSSAACAITLTLRPLGNAHAVDYDGRCLSGLRLDGVAAWRPATDGLALAAADGRTVAFFAHESGGYVLRRPGSAALLLRPGAD
jgi:hypothetical protein